MASLTDIVDLSSLGLKPGGAVRFDVSVPVGPFIFGEQRYELITDPIPVTLDVTRTRSGNVIRISLSTHLNGPCMRCYGDYSMPLIVEHSEVHEPFVDEDLASEYVDGRELDLAALVRDSIALNLPTSIASPVDDSGVCTECASAEERLGALRDDPVGKEKAQPDPRWAKLRELEL